MRRLLLLALLAAGCAISGGNVVGTSLEPAHSESYVVSNICVAHDSQNYGCTMSVPIYGSRHVPDRCWLTVRDTEGDGRQATWGIPCDARDQYIIGQWADRP